MPVTVSSSPHPSPPMRDAFYTGPPGDPEDLFHDILHHDDHKLTQDFIKSRQSTASNDPIIGFSNEAAKRLRIPHGQPTLPIEKDTRLAIDLYLGNASEETYTTISRIISWRYPGMNMFTYSEIKRLVADLTGIEPIIHDMCTNLCIVYTGPFLRLTSCPNCSEPRYVQFWLQASGGEKRSPAKSSAASSTAPRTR